MLYKASKVATFKEKMIKEEQERIATIDGIVSLDKLSQHIKESERYTQNKTAFEQLFGKTNSIEQIKQIAMALAKNGFVIVRE